MLREYIEIAFNDAQKRSLVSPLLQAQYVGLFLADIVKNGPATAGDVREGPVRSLSWPDGAFYFKRVSMDVCVVAFVLGQSRT